MTSISNIIIWFRPPCINKFKCTVNDVETKNSFIPLSLENTYLNPQHLYIILFLIKSFNKCTLTHTI